MGERKHVSRLLSARIAACAAVLLTGAGARAADRPPETDDGLEVPEPPPRISIEVPEPEHGYGGFADLRFAGLAGISRFSGTLHPQGSGLSMPLSGSYAYDVTTSFRGVWSTGLHRYGGPIFGAGVALRLGGGLAGQGSTAFSFLPTLELGYGLPFGRNVQMEAAGTAEAGLSVLYPRLDEVPSSSILGFRYGVGAQASLVYTFDGGFQIGAQGGYAGTWDTYPVLDAKTFGWRAGASLGNRF